MLLLLGSAKVSMIDVAKHNDDHEGHVYADLETLTVARALAYDTDFWFDNHWILDSTPVEWGRSRPTAQRSDAAGWAAYCYCASHSRFFWGLRPLRSALGRVAGKLLGPAIGRSAADRPLCLPATSTLL